MNVVRFPKDRSKGYEVIKVLTSMEWLTVAEIAERAGVSKTTAARHLNRALRNSVVVRRYRNDRDFYQLKGGA